MSSNSTQTAIAAGLETAKSLVQRVSRAFYGPRQSIVLDQLIRKEAMRDDELAGRVGMPTRDLAKITQKLLEDQIISIHRRSELKEGAPKAQQRSYYYMDYSHATDVIKWRMYKIQETIDVKLRNELQNQGYVCPNCKKSFTPLDASDLFDPERNILACDVCGSEVDNNENEADVRGNKDRMQRLVEQTRIIRDSLKKMDDVVLPRFDVVKWCDLNGPTGGPTDSVDAAVESGSVTVELAGDDDEAKMKAKKEADADEKRAQNQLPTWIAQSTISGEASTASLQSTSHLTALALSSSNNKSSNDLDRKASISHATTAALTKKNLDADLDSYYKKLAEQAAEVELPLSSVGSPILRAVKEEEQDVYSELNFDEEKEKEKEKEREKEQADEIENVMKSMHATTTATSIYSATPVTNNREDTSTPVETGTNGNGSGKRSRDEVELGWEGGDDDLSTDLDGISGKRMRINSGSNSIIDQEEGIEGNNTEGRREESEVVDGTPSAVLDDEEDEFEDDDLEEEGDLDPNPLLSVDGKMVPFLEIDEELTGAMTPEEYTAYWNVFALIGE